MHIFLGAYNNQVIQILSSDFIEYVMGFSIHKRGILISK